VEVAAYKVILRELEDEVRDEEIELNQHFAEADDEVDEVHHLDEADDVNDEIELLDYLW
jgi:hypothetical protein